MELIKSILFGMTLIVLSYRVFKSNQQNLQERNYFISSFIITLIILFIIVLKVHHYLRHTYGIPDTLTYFFVLIFGIYHIWNFRYLIKNSNYFILILASVSLISAVILDLLTDAKIVNFPASDLSEEILRIGGAIFWFIYYIKPGFKQMSY